MPTSLGRRAHPPAAGMMPRLVSGNPRIVFSVITRMSEHKLNSQPPPSANPSITAIVGHGMFSNAVKALLISLTLSINYAGVETSLNFKSAPAQNMPG